MKNQWYLRTQDETFGPETKERLIEWARMGRIQPGQDISEDGETWRPATEIPFLDMRWSIDIGDGQIAELTKTVAQKEADRARTEQELAARNAEIQQLQGEIEQFKQQIADLKEEMEKRQTPHAREWSTDVIEPEIVADEMPPPVARQAFDARNASVLADLERRAQQELARMGPLQAKKFFKIKK